MSLIDSFFSRVRPNINILIDPYKREQGININDMIKEKHIALKNKLNYKIVWHNPETAFQTINLIVYDNKLKQNIIKRNIKRIESQECQVKKIMINAETQLLFLKTIYKYFKKNIEYSKYIEELQSEFERYHNYYVPILEYYIRLPSINIQYGKLLIAAQSRNHCRICLKWCNVIKRTKHGNQCNTCMEGKSLLLITKECPVCLEDIKINNYTKTNCDNNHILCSPCYYKLQNYSNKCPLCRGNL